MGRIAFGKDLHRIIAQFMSDDARNPRCQILVRLQIEQFALAAVPADFEQKGNIGPRHGETAHHVQTGSLFAARGAQELAACRNLGEQVFHPHPRPGGERSGSVLDKLAMIDHPPPAFCSTAFAAFHGQAGDAGDRRQGLAAKSERRHQFNCLIRTDQRLGQFRGCMAFERQRHCRRCHPAAIIAHLDAPHSAIPEGDSDSLCTGINRVLDQLFERGCRAFNHLARSDAVDQMRGKAANLRHFIPR